MSSFALQDKLEEKESEADMHTVTSPTQQARGRCVMQLRGKTDDERDQRKKS